MSWIKNFLVIAVVSLCALKISDVVYRLIDSNGTGILSTGSRSIFLREHDPRQDVVVIPSDIYMTSTDGLIQKQYAISIDDNGFIRNGNPDVISDDDLVIAFIGGSTTESIYVDEKNRFPSVVERQLRKDYSPNVKTINAGVSGNNSFHSLLIFLGKVLPENPDFVVLMHNINDFALLSKTGSYWNAPEGRNIVKGSSDSPTISPQITVVSILRKVKNLLIPNLYGYLKPRLFPQLVFADEFSNDRGIGIDEHSGEIISMFERSLRSFVAVSHAWGVKPVLMTQFNRVSVNDELFIPWVTSLGFAKEADKMVELYKALNEVTRNVAKDTNSYLIDLDIRVPKSPQYIYDVVHLNNSGSKLVGDLITTELIKVLPK